MKQFELKWLEHGQRRSYGNSYYTCEIHTKDEMTDDEILLVTQEKGRLPKEEWDKKRNSIDDYFKGYYTIEKPIMVTSTRAYIRMMISRPG